MTRRSQFTTALVAAMVAISMLGMAVPAGASSSTGPTEQVYTIEDGEDLYLLFGVEGEVTKDDIKEMVSQGAADSPSAMATQQDSVSNVIQYQDVGQVNIVEQGEAVSVAIGGGEATAIQDVDQQNANSQVGEASAENYNSNHVETSFEDVGDVYVVMGNSQNPQFNGWGVTGDDGKPTVAQTAQASVSQAQAVNQANVKQGTVAFAYAEDESTATAIQLTEQSNLNRQEGSAVATNVYAEDLDSDPNKSYHERHQKHDGVSSAQSAEASVEQAQEVQQANVYEMGGAVAIAVGENATATAVQITEQSNLNEQIGSAEALNVMLDSPGMNVATASTTGGSSIVDQNVDAQGADQKDHDKKKDDGDADLNQTAEASVTQYQSIEQANVDLNSTAVAIATDGGTSDAVQLTFQENINVQVASAQALNVYLGDLSKHDKSLDAKGIEEGKNVEGSVITETTTAVINGDAIEGADTVAFDYHGQNEQLNDVDQYSTAEVAQVQNITQLNLHSNTALAIAEGGEASAVQLTMQENENVQVTESNATTVNEGEPTDGQDGTDGDDGTDGTDGDDGTDGTDGNSVEATQNDEDDAGEGDESMPGFGAAVALVAMLAAAMLARRS